MVVAAARGLLRPIRRGDKMAKLRESLLLQELRREQKAELARMQFDRDIAAAQYFDRDKEFKIFDHHRKQSQKSLMRWLAATQPHVDWDKRLEDMDREEWARDVKLWEDNWGNLDDPEVQAEIDRLADWLANGESGVSEE